MKEIGRKLLRVFLMMAMVIGLLPGMSLPAYADDDSLVGTIIKKGNNLILNNKYIEFTPGNPVLSDGAYNLHSIEYKAQDSGWGFVFTNGNFLVSGPEKPTPIGFRIASGNGESLDTAYRLELAYDSYTVTVTHGSNMTKTTDSGAESQTVSGPNQIQNVVYNADTGYQFPATSDYYGTTNGITVTRTSETVVTVSGTPTADVSVTIPDVELAPVPVEGIFITTAKTNITVGSTTALVAEVDPNTATDKTVKWSIGGTDADTVKLYSNEACTTEVGTAATSILTVYAKGISIGNAIVTVTTNDGNKTATCPLKVRESLTPVSYLDWNGSGFDTKTCSDYAVVTDSDSDITWDEDWYVVNENKTINGDISINGNVRLILCNGTTLTANSIVGTGNLTIYAQSTDDTKGSLTVNNKIEISGNLTINGGNVTCTPGGSIDAIYTSGSITISEGKVTTNGMRSNGGSITINGGEVESNTTGDSGINSNYNMTISGGTVTAIGKKYGISCTSKKVIINSTIVKVIASGGTKAIKDNVVNGVEGTGWTDKGGTTGREKINAATTEDGQPLSFLKVQFPEAPVEVTGITLNETAATLTLDESIKLTATVSPEDATDKTVKWSVGGINPTSVTLYTDETCSTCSEVGTGATSSLTVYAKGISAGSATVTVTSNSDATKSATCAVTVNKKIQTISEPQAVENLTYNGNEQNLLSKGVTVSQGIPDGVRYKIGENGTWSDNTSLPRGKDAGTYNVFYKVLGNDTYEEYVSENSIKVTIAKVDQEVTAPTAAVNLKYTGYSQNLLNNRPVVIKGPSPATTQFKVDDGSWSTNLPVATTVGEHTVLYKIEGNTNYNEYTGQSITVSIGKGDNPTTVNSIAIVTKGGKTVDLEENVNLKGAKGAVTYQISSDAKGCSLDGSVLTSGENTGSVKVEVTVAADDNYNASEPMYITVTISDKPTQTINVKGTNVTYGDSDKKIEATTTGDGTISYAIKEGNDVIGIDKSTGALTVKKPGNAIVTVTAAETDTYAPATKEVIVTVSNKYTVVEDNQTWEKGSTSDLTIIFNAKYDDTDTFYRWTKPLVIDGENVAETCYDPKSGSLKIILKPDYLETLSTGKHTMNVTFSDGSASAVFNIKTKSSGSGSSTPEKKKDNVVTCQMAGYPADYAWNEAAKACQPGYIDSNGVFHSTAKAIKVPNTYDKGVTGNMVSLFVAMSFAFIAACLLRKY